MIVDESRSPECTFCPTCEDQVETGKGFEHSQTIYCSRDCAIKSLITFTNALQEEIRLLRENPLTRKLSFNDPDALLKIIALDHTNEAVLRCPVCGDPTTHVQTAYTRSGVDKHEAVFAYPKTENNGTTDYRRSALCVLVEGESCGHRFEIIFQQHKGETFVQVGILEGAETQPASVQL
jgi:hypothetical protein